MSTELRDKMDDALPWRVAYPYVERYVKAFFRDHMGMLTTAELVEKLWPIADVHNECDARGRDRIFRALKALATRELSAYNRRAAKKVAYRGQLIAPRVWSAPDAVHVQAGEICPTCKRPL